MDYTLFMQILETNQDFPQDVLYDILSVPLVIFLNYVSQITGHKLEKDPNSVSKIVRLIYL